VHALSIWVMIRFLLFPMACSDRFILKVSPYKVGDIVYCRAELFDWILILRGWCLAD